MSMEYLSKTTHISVTFIYVAIGTKNVDETKDSHNFYSCISGLYLNVRMVFDMSMKNII